jgi:GTP-binding protein EngB required for normal cell division
MTLQEREAHRTFMIDALNELEGFVRHDPSFGGNKAFESKSLGYQRQAVQDGKYRIVFLGTFNVGKSTAINAFLGGAYLPMDVEECTSKLTFIQRGESLKLVMGLNEAASREEIDALSHFFSEIPAEIEASDEGRELRVSYRYDSPDSMCKSLEPLVTVLADETYPLLAPLRDKVEEMSLYIPSTALAEDIVFVDTPGVHTVSETRQHITYDIIERSHLVVAFVDSGLVGNVHDLNFIKRIIKWRGRRVFFVLNKADKLETDEIDIRGSRGPALSLIQAFKRHDIPEDSEIFFLSGYRALRAQELDKGLVELEDILEDNKVSIPLGISNRLNESDDPKRDLSAYLMGQSRFPNLKDQLYSYLLHEDKAVAVLGAAGRFVCERAAEYALPLENELRLARDPSKFDALRENREGLMEQLEDIRSQAHQVLSEYDARALGGYVGSEKHLGYEFHFRDALSAQSIDEQVVLPIVQWLREGTHLKEARRDKFKVLQLQLEHQVDEFVSSKVSQLHEIVEEVETDARVAIAEKLFEIRELRIQMTEPSRMDIPALTASVTGSYAAFGAGGAMVGAAAGFAAGTVLPGVGNIIGAGIGALLGVLSGLLARLVWSEDRWLRKLEPIIRDNVLNMLLRGSVDQEGQRTAPVLETVLAYVQERARAFHEAVEEEVEEAVNAVQAECDDLLAREEEIRADSEQIIARLEPKVTLLHELRDKSAAILTPDTPVQ